ncbi:MAG: sn-glycerol-3-phosphate ABC transporter ATP-binding protein UgpC [Solirubrobacteraceae bacterium]
MASISYIDATCIYQGATVPSVAELSLDVQDGEFMVLVGPSGSGKSTALRMLAGLEPVSSGEIHIDGADVSHKPPKDRDIAMVFQNYALYPHMTVAENMGYALKLRGLGKGEREAKVSEAAGLLDLQNHLDRRPKSLSGGQRQRVAMGRAIVREPRVFLMDEPLSNLDAKLRVETRANIAGLQARLGTTTVYVTHDQVEAMTMGHRVAVLKDARLQQVDTPRNLYERPANVFVAGFIGSPAMNLRGAKLAQEGVLVSDTALPLPADMVNAARAAGLDEVTIGFRPESASLAPAGTPGALALTVALVEELGADAYVYGELAGDTPDDKPWVVRCEGRAVPRIGDKVSVAVQASDAHLFNPQTGLRLK